MKTDARISVVVPVYNRADVVSDTLDSIASQACEELPVHLVVIDNDSSDGSFDIVDNWRCKCESPFLKVTLAKCSIPGAAAARNAGLDLVDTDLVAFFDSDDRMRRGALMAYVDAFRRNPTADVVRGMAVYHSFDGKVTTLRHKAKNLLTAHLHHCILRTHVYAVRTSFIRRLGGWNKELRIWDDWELGARILLSGAYVVRLDRVVADIIATPDSLSGNRYSDRHAHYDLPLMAVEEAIMASGRQDALRLLRMIVYRRVMLAALYRREGEKELARLAYREARKLFQGDIRLRLLMPLAYRYISLGGRGCASLIAPLL